MKIKPITVALLTFLLTISGQLFILQPVAHAQTDQQVCDYLNNQQGTPDPNSNVDPNNPLNGKFVTITEEPLGQDTQGFSYRCARQTVCVFDSKVGTTWSVGSKCTVKYVPVSSCNGSTTAQSTDAQNNGGEVTNCEIVQVYVASAGTDLLYKYIGQIYRYVASIGGLLAVFIMIYSGIMIASAGDNQDALKKAKDRITRSIMGLILLFLSAVILYVINPNFFVV